MFKNFQNHRRENLASVMVGFATRIGTCIYELPFVGKYIGNSPCSLASCGAEAKGNSLITYLNHKRQATF